MDMHFQFTLAAYLIAALDIRTCVYAESCAANAQPTVRRGSFFHSHGRAIMAPIGASTTPLTQFKKINNTQSEE